MAQEMFLIHLNCNIYIPIFHNYLYIQHYVYTVRKQRVRVMTVVNFGAKKDKEKKIENKLNCGRGV